MLKRKQYQTPWIAAILVVLMPLLWGCAVKHLPSPNPVYGVDIVKANRTLGAFIALNEDVSAYDGIFFSKEYLNEYLQYRCQDGGKC